MSSIIENYLKQFLTTQIRYAEWEIKDGDCGKKDMSLYPDADGIAAPITFYALGNWYNAEYDMDAIFEDNAFTVDDDDHRIMETTIRGKYKEDVMSQARAWLLANVENAVDAWAKRYATTKPKPGKAHQNT